ncbi:MAG: Lrp/AsnC family transcriptional regulator [Promethearchaeota archaeon]
MTVNSKFYDLTELDIRILKKLSEDDRISHRQLGRDLDNKSPITIKKHVEELERRDIIKDYRINLDYEKIGYDIIAIIEMTIEKGKLIEVEKIIAQDPHIYAVYDITGEYDALILARFRTRNEMNKMIKKIHTFRYVQRTNTHLVLKIVKEGSSFTDLMEEDKEKM